MVRVAYRATQFWKAITAVPDRPGFELAESILSPALQAEFLKMQPSEIHHSLEIVRALLAAGESNPDLLVAALLHDLGKCRTPLRAWERAIVVVGKRFFPAACHRWGNSGELRGWKRMFVVTEQHPAWGAEMAGQAGASPLTVRLIRRHHEPRKLVSKEGNDPGSQTQEDYFLYRLQLVDDES